MSTQNPIPTLHHVTFKTNRLDEMVAWYGEVTGLTPVHQRPEGAWLRNDDANHRIAFLAVPGISDDPEKLTRAGMHHTAFEFDSPEQLFETYERMKAGGTEPHACVDHGMTTSFYYVDPDGNSVELQADNFGGDWAASTEFMRSDPRFLANPFGAQIDPAAMVAEWRRGTDVGALHERAYAGEFDPGRLRT